MTAFISEFRSMTFQCKSEISSAIQFSEINNYIGRDHTMAPKQHETLAKSSDQVLEAEQSRENQVSPISSLGGTSLESSSPVLPNMTASNSMNHNYDLDRSHMADPSSDDSVSMTNELSGYQEEMTSPLEQLQCALGKDGMLGQKLHLSEYPGQKDDVRNSSNASLSSAEQSCIYFDNSDMYKCHLCSYASSSKQDFNVHMNSHFDHKCPYCDYTSRTEGRLKRHVKDFHSETPPESWAGTRIPRAELSGAEQSMDDSVTSSNGKSRTYRCKQCDFVAYQKNDFWEHNKSHIKAEKLLSCPQCAFVTEYKHHLEYHIRNHFGSKPFKCSKCNYSCVNKSMLNSHMKSHSNIYQYRCANCTYATKYCHSLKLHLRKYEHKPATVLNLDGTPNPYPVIDVYGTRRGPRTKKRRCMDDTENSSVSSTAAISSQPSLNYSSSVPLLPPNVPVMYPSQFFNGYPNSLYMKTHQPANNPNYPLGMSHVRVKHDSPLKCILCDFVTDHQELFHKHMIMHAATENQDIVKLYGISSDSLLHFQDQLMFNNYMQSQKHYLEHHSRAERKGFDTFEQHKERPTNGYEPEVKVIKDEDENSLSSQRNMKNASPRNELSSPIQNNSDLPYEIERPDVNDDNERTVIVAHKSSPRPSMMLEMMETDALNPNLKNIEHSPLDLSGPKSLDSAQKINDVKTPEANSDNEETKHVSPSGTDNSSAIQRNRRKGKAFKIDHYIQYDQPSNAETHTSLNNPNNCVESQKNMMQSQYDDTKSQQSLTADTKEHKPHSQEKLQNMPFQIINSVDSSNRNRSPIHNPIPLDYYRSNDEVLKVESSKNDTSPPVFKESIQVAKEIHLKNKQNTTPEPSLSPRVEVEIEQKNISIKKRQEIFECEYCAMAFKDCVMYTVHMGYHGFGDPFTCNMCGQESKDRVEFFIHIARSAHV